jgi:hypothetical protein
MASERDFEEVLARHPELIEEGLRLIGRQVTLCGRRMDLLFEDRFGQKLVVELKWGPIKDEHVGQIMYYQGALLSGGEPVRTMLIGTRVPPPIQKSLDFNGLASKEIRLSALIEFLKAKGEADLVRTFEADLSLGEVAMKRKPSKRGTGPAAAIPLAAGVAPALFAPVQEGWIKKAFKDFECGKGKLRFASNSPQLRDALEPERPINNVYFKATGNNEICARARFLSIDKGPPEGDRLTGSNKNDVLWEARYYYGFCDLSSINNPIPLSALRRYPSKKQLRNDVPGACLIFDDIGTG